MTIDTKIGKPRDWLERGHTISQKQAIDKWNYYRLSGGIHVLRHKYGMNIRRKDVPSPSGDSMYGLYWLEKEAN